MSTDDMNDPAITFLKAFPTTTIQDPMIMKGLVTVAVREAVDRIVDLHPGFGSNPSGYAFLVSFWDREGIDQPLPPGEWTVMRVDADRMDDEDDHEDPTRDANLNPECRAGKHPNCDGKTIDVASDQFVPCACSCHVLAA